MLSTWPLFYKSVYQLREGNALPNIFVFCCCDKMPTKINLVRKGFILAYKLQSVIERSQGRSWRQELKQRPWSNDVYCLVPLGLPSYLPYITQHHLPIRIHSCYWHCFLCSLVTIALPQSLALSALLGSSQHAVGFIWEQTRKQERWTRGRLESFCRLIWDLAPHLLAVFC